LREDNCMENLDLSLKPPGGSALGVSPVLCFLFYASFIESVKA
jgi:hypothetical protein